ncbi:exonuclease V [Tricharina praecox]|uniref:exonuclease V n=1 Tax=Tricharina praecox TaxID=43433 RepID=UPI002220ACA5|nr:exonuclease V [Tricharina praecox]KAI5848925.1 exonuclease V [Tricharina praecox]
MRATMAMQRWQSSTQLYPSASPCPLLLPRTAHALSPRSPIALKTQTRSISSAQKQSLAAVGAAATPEPSSLSLSSPSAEDTRSPYDRFRSRRKALSVTDLVSNIWCEQQFEYTLLRGFKRKTPQMRRGTQVHKALEEQVQTAVPVDVSSKREDAWGLKMFNMYQGLASLKHNGLTRELPVFGFLGNTFVQGIVDEVSFVPPHTRAEERRRTAATAATAAAAERVAGEEDPEIVLGEEDTTDAFGVPPMGERIAYLSDTKTRVSRSLPSSSQVRATAIQLMLYHRLLSHMHLGTVDLGKALDLFKLDGGVEFSDSFIAQMAGLDSGISLETLLEHNSIWGMWELVRRQAEESMDGIGAETGVSYRSQADGSMIGFMPLKHDDKALDAHLVEVMKWWNGERSTVGVDIEDAWKCGSCEFQDTCEWRLSKLQLDLQGRSAKKRKFPARKRSVVV